MRFLFFCHRLLQKVSAGRASFAPYLFYAQPVSSTGLESRGKAVNPVVRAMARDCLPLTLPRPEAVILQRFANGSRCLFLEKEGELVGYLWLHFGPYREDEVRAVFVPEPAALSAWDYDVYVAPAYRLGRAFARLWDAANDDLRVEGVRWCHSRISAFNPNSRAVHEKLGARLVGWAGFLCLGRFQIMVSSLRPWLHLSIKGTPVLSLPSPKG